MKAGLKAVVMTVGFLGALVLGAMALVGPSDAVTGKNCKDITVGPGWQSKVNVAGHPSTVTVTAPAGYLIDEYCVKAGSGSDAAVIVLVQPPATEVVIDHPAKDYVSQYAIQLVPVSVVTDTPSGPVPTDTVSGPAPSGVPSGPVPTS